MQPSLSQQQPIPAWQRAVPLGMLAIAVAALAIAYIAQYSYGLEPCALCLWQRLPYAAVIVLAMAGLAIGSGPGGTRRTALLVGLGGLAFLAGGALAFYHVGVEQHWWTSVTGCGGGLPASISIGDLQAALNAPPPKSCDAIDWTFVGLSMATWNAMLSPLFAVVCGLAAHRMLKWVHP